ncbi:hypothetical protein EVAR_82222_1 [Eumeta japonica]|uniref:Uncharacterized protein n=1 Tax=Eumeta variegata TaxID=151549 RepID=A0A4C1W5E1_EUMVA|nr:hypothetical protein EVAR_82222_1 [Eumeta japonica]
MKYAKKYANEVGKYCLKKAYVDPIGGTLKKYLFWTPKPSSLVEAPKSEASPTDEAFFSTFRRLPYSRRRIGTSQPDHVLISICVRVWDSRMDLSTRSERRKIPQIDPNTNPRCQLSVRAAERAPL